MTSLRERLLIWLLLGLTVSTAVASWAVYTRARSEAREIFDLQLQRMAAAFPEKGFGVNVVPPSYKGAASDDVMVVQIWDRNGKRLYISHEGSDAPQVAILGFSTIAASDGYWRVYSTILHDNIVQVAQPVGVREELAASLAARTMLPIVVLFPALIALVWITVGRSLRPLNEIAAEVAGRSANTLEPLSDRQVPTEVRPLVAALNGLFVRLESALRMQRSFIADAAHELRTPLTAVQLQTQLAERARTDEERAAAFAKLKGGAERATHLVRQLLTLARAEPEALTQAPERVNLTAVARQVISEQASTAEAHGVDLGLSGDASVPVMGHFDSLQVLLGNLVDNAVRYTPPGGTVDVETRIQDSHACLVVSDTGPGISVAERQRVFDRFYRHDGGATAGSGLGLSIVRKLAQRHGASLTLGDGHDGRGLKVTVHFPAV